MFFCEACRNKRDWPKSFAKSHGACELCGKISECYDVHHSKCFSPHEMAIKTIEERLEKHDFTGEPIDDAFCDIHPLARNYLSDDEIEKLGNAGARAVIRAFLRWALNNTDE